MNVRPILTAIGQWGKRHAPKLLAAGAIAAEAAGFWFMHKEAPVVRDRLNALPKDAKIRQKLKVAAPIYIPAIGMFLLSSGCVIGGCIIGERRAAILTSLYTASEAALRKVESKAVEEIGPDKVKELKESVGRDMVAAKPPTDETIFLTGKGTDLFFEPETSRYFRSSPASFDEDIAKVYNEIISNEWADMNDFNVAVGLPTAKISGMVGWLMSSLHERSITKLCTYYGTDVTINGKKELCYIINYNAEPTLYNGKRPLEFHNVESCYIY